MQALIITVAGLSSRFSASIQRDVLKCTYTESDAVSTLLYRMLSLAEGSFDRIVIVGGHRFDELCAYIDDHVPSILRESITMVFNEHYADRGSGWSLYLGLEALDLSEFDSVTFIEGDLYFDEGSFAELCLSDRDTLTFNRLTIDASTSVAFYIDGSGHPRYIYDTAHGDLVISEPFTRIYNSAQAWRFSDPSRLGEVVAQLSESKLVGTNLELINGYFSPLDLGDIRLLEFEEWINCNTVQDYRNAFGKEWDR